MVDNWINAVKTNANSDTLLCLLGNKNDLEERRVVSKRENAEKGTQFECFFSQEVSAKTGYNVKETFIEIAKTLYNRTLAAPKEPENYINISICQTIGRRLTFSKKKEGTTDGDNLNLSNPELDEGDVIHKVHENKKRKRNNNLCCA